MNRGLFSYPIGLESLKQLGYPLTTIEVLAPELLERFVGAGNPFSIQELCKGAGTRYRLRLRPVHIPSWLVFECHKSGPPQAETL